MIKWVIFDFDGTLVDSKDLFISAFNQLAEKYNYRRLDLQEIEYLRGLSVWERCRYLNFPLYKLPFLKADFSNIYKQHAKKLVLFEGVKELLKELQKRGYHLAIISSNAEKNIRDILQRNQVDIQEIFCSHDVFGKNKVIGKFLKVKRLQASEVIYVGDEQRDIAACKKSGVKIIWVEWGYDTAAMAKKEGPHYMASTPADILSVIKAG